MHKSLYVGQDLALDAHCDGHPISLVTFEARNKHIDALEPSPFGKGFGKGVFAAKGFNEFIIKKSRNHWYQTDEIVDVIEIIKEAAHGTKIVTYGTSMGGFAAINYSALLGASHFIALSPLYDIAPDSEVEDDRWGQEPHVLNFHHNWIRNGNCRTSCGYIFYGDNELDQHHAVCIARETNGILVPVDYGGHPCSYYLNDAYSLKKLVIDISRDQFDLERFRTDLAESTSKTFYPYLKESRRREAAGDMEGAIDAARQAISFANTRHDLKRRLGNLLLEKGDLDGAEHAFRESLQIDSDDPLTHIRFSYVHAARGDYGSAAKEVELAIRISGANPKYHLRLGEWLLKKKDYKSAEIAMSRAISLWPTSDYAKVRLSYVFAAMGQYRRAVEVVRDAINLAPDKPELHSRIAEWHIKNDDLANAKIALETVIQLNPDAKIAPTRLKMVLDLIHERMLSHSVPLEIGIGNLTNVAEEFAKSLVSLALNGNVQIEDDIDYEAIARERATAFATAIEGLIDAKIAAALDHP